jgi:hypothetical protein
MYYPQAPKEPSGCMQTLILTRMIITILLVPIGLIFGAIFVVLMTFYALSVHPLLALIPLGLGGATIYVGIQWEKKRVEREAPPPE